MITVNLFTSGRHTQPLIKALEEAKNVKLVNIYEKLPDLSADFVGRRPLRRPKAEALAKADIFIVADFGQIIPKKILEIPEYGALCVHPSLLPKYRGASPVPQAILNGERETGVTIFKMDEKVDHGPIIAQFKRKIRNDDTAETLLIRLFTLGSQLLLKILPDYFAGKIKPAEQNHAQATYTHILKKEDGKINCLDLKEAMEAGGPKAVEIERKIRALTPWPGAWTTIHPRGGVAPAAHLGGEKRLKLLKAHLEPSIPHTKLVLDEAQLEGKKPVSWKQFCEGYKTDLSKD